MRFACPRCSAKYRLDESKIKVDVLKFQCRKCSATLNIKIPSEKAAKPKVPRPATVPVPPKMKASAPKLEDLARENEDDTQLTQVPHSDDNLIKDSSSLSKDSISTNIEIPEEVISKSPSIDSPDLEEPVPEVKRIPVATYNQDEIANEIDEIGTQTFIIEAGLGEAHNRRKKMMLFGLGGAVLLLGIISVNFFLGQAPKVKTLVSETAKKYEHKKKPKKKFVFTEEEKRRFAQMGKSYEEQLAENEEREKQKQKEEFVFNENDEPLEETKGSKKIREKVKLSDSQKKSLMALYSNDVDVKKSSLDIKGPDLPVFAPKKELKKSQTGASLEDLKQKESRDLRRALDKHLRGLEFCYEMALKSNRKLRGKVMMDLSISKNGKVKKLSLEMGKMDDARFKSCLLARIKQWKFSGISKEEISLSIPYSFEPRY